MSGKKETRKARTREQVEKKETAKESETKRERTEHRASKSNNKHRPGSSYYREETRRGWEGADGVKELDQVTRSVGRVSGLAVAWLSGSAKGGGRIQATREW